MQQNYGNQLAVRETKKSTIIWIRIGAVIFLLLVGAVGIYTLLNPIDGEDTIIGLGLLGIGVLICAILFFVSAKIKKLVTIFEEGVVLKNGSKEHRFHFSEIAGLADAGSGGTYFIPLSGGLVGALVMGTAAAVAGAAADASRRRNRIRNITIMPVSGGSSRVPVVNTGGDELSQVYTQWLIKQKSVTKENLDSLVLSFGAELEFNAGMFIHKRKKGDESYAFSDITALKSDSSSGILRFFGLNEKGKEKNLFNVSVNAAHNIDLLFYLFELRNV
jgi:hypothetical protein